MSRVGEFFGDPEFLKKLAYLDLVARCDHDWFYYWGTERER